MNRLIPIFLAGACLAACTTQRQAAVEQPAPVPLPPAPPAGEPADLAGLAPAQLKNAFGEPAFVRKDSGVEMWRYDSPACKAFFFLYPAGTTFSVRHVETLPRGQQMAADAACLEVLRAHARVS
ncbi:MAG TPA: hypothetical protein VGF97_17460 [Rhizomicrobium sp.]